MIKRIVLTLFLIFLALASLFAHENNLQLPIYKIQIDSLSLLKLYANPFSDEYFTAEFSYDSVHNKCAVRFRGATARKLPKKNWRIKFDDHKNIFNIEKLNLNSEYRDSSLIRNHLAMRLFQYLGYPASNTQFVTFFVNDVYQGVFLQVEQIDELFLSRNNRTPNSLYKAKNHGAGMAPLVRFEKYNQTWEKKIGNVNDYNDIQLLFSKFLYWNKFDFRSETPAIIDIDNVLNYFAVQYAIVGIDGFSKNFYLNYNDKINKWEIFPWDCDSSFGNDIYGIYHHSFATVSKGIYIDFQVLFQRLIEFEDWRSEFLEKLDRVVHEGFDYLLTEIDTTYIHIKNDVYLDSAKVGSNSVFENDIIRIKNFLNERKTFLENHEFYIRIPLSNFFCSNPFPSKDSSEVIFNVTSEKLQPVYLKFVRNLNWSQWGSPYSVDYLELFDDGQHHDGAAGDLIYGNTLTFAECDTGLIPYCYYTSGITHPPNGLFYVNAVRTHTLALNLVEDADVYQFIEITKVIKNNNNLLIELQNKSEKDIDLSYCYFQAGKYYNRFILPENTIVESQGKLIISSNKNYSDFYFPNIQSIGNVFFELKIGDTLKLLSPSLTEFYSTVFNSSLSYEINSVPVVINEINYNSSDDFDTEDWIEFFNPNDSTIKLDGWYFKDEDDDHIFEFPDGTKIPSNHYLVLCRNSAKFHSLFPDLENYIGDMDFGLSGHGELVRLFDPTGNIIDSLTYGVTSPWPTEPDGNGPTLELRNPDLDNSFPQNWVVSTGHGTPGSENIISTGITNELEPLSQFFLSQNHPNPFNQQTKINFDLNEPAIAYLKIYNLKGQLFKMLTSEPGENHFIWNGSGLSSGIYFYQVEMNGKKSEIKKAILLK